jgi:hypothetical protein
MRGFFTQAGLQFSAPDKPALSFHRGSPSAFVVGQLLGSCEEYNCPQRHAMCDMLETIVSRMSFLEKREASLEPFQQRLLPSLL